MGAVFLVVVSCGWASVHDHLPMLGFGSMRDFGENGRLGREVVWRRLGGAWEEIGEQAFSEQHVLLCLCFTFPTAPFDPSFR